MTPEVRPLGSFSCPMGTDLGTSALLIIGPRGRRSRIQSYCSWETVMRTTRQLSITLPIDMADALRERVRSGEYASESEVVRDGLRALFARDQAVEAWLR